MGDYYKAPKTIVRAAVKAANSFSVVHDNIDMDLAQAHVDGAIERLLVDRPAFKRAVKAVPDDLIENDLTKQRVAQAVVLAFLGVKR